MWDGTSWAPRALEADQLVVGVGFEGGDYEAQCVDGPVLLLEPDVVAGHLPPGALKVRLFALVDQGDAFFEQPPVIVEEGAVGGEEAYP